ncbi:MAG TPA: M14 family metallopeptidase, partial [Candidatus Udaeobacter sp.]|nr:M14 family metallopeptidase [Candidatus Udaeobacter sp.]
MPSLAELDRGFRKSYLSFADLTEQVMGWATAFPNLCRVRSIGRSLEGRDLWLVSIGPDLDRARPAVWIDGNMHAVELAGSSVALAMAEDALRLHLGEPLHDFPAHMGERLRQVVFHVLPRMSPDGAECVLATGRYVRSAPRDRRANKQHARWLTGDIDGDGLALLMRRRDPAGEFVESTEVPGLMLPRLLEDPPPYYRIFPEGTIEHWDGHAIPRPNYLSDNQTDLNRNFPYSWRHERDQQGAGAFPGSEPESRAVIEFASDHPEIFAWLNCHTFGGVFIRPLGDGPDSKMDPTDLAIFREIGAWSEDLTGYPMVSGFQEFLYSADTPLYGDL